MQCSLFLVIIYEWRCLNPICNISWCLFFFCLLLIPLVTNNCMCKFKWQKNDIESDTVCIKIFILHPWTSTHMPSHTMEWNSHRKKNNNYNFHGCSLNANEQTSTWLRHKGYKCVRLYLRLYWWIHTVWISCVFFHMFPSLAFESSVSCGFFCQRQLCSK